MLNVFMDTLFHVDPIYPSGFTYYPEFIDQDEEAQLLKVITTLELRTFLFQGFEAKRRIASFGYDYSFDKRSLSKGKEIPAVFHPLIDKVAGWIHISPEAFAELLITEYPVGAVINWHRDAPPFDIIAGISLSADCTFKLKPHEQVNQKRGPVISIPVQRRSLYVIAEKREQHGNIVRPP